MADRFDRGGVAATQTGAPPEEPSVAELVKKASEQTALLVRQEIELGKLEITEKAKHAGIGAGAFGAAGVCALYGVGAGIATIIIALATAMDTWLAALITTVALFAVAGVLALFGKKQTEQAVPPVPEETVESVQEDIDTIKARSGR